jgi:hypothetical protein
MSGKIGIGPDTSIEELVESYPRSVGFLMDRGVVCLKCGEPVWGTLGEMIAMKGLDIGETVADLRAFLEKAS